jgi:CDP-paratose 2-epimerase
LEYCRRNSAGFLLLSTSRVYNIDTLLKLPLYETSSRFSVLDNQSISGFSSFGIAESFSTITPLSLYGATKYASEVMALEYGNAFNIPIWINRCGVIGGPGQFGKIDQGIFAFWVYSCAIKKPLKYIGFDGKGKQVRDVVNAEDIARLIGLQINDPYKIGPRVLNIGGGNNGSMSLFEITQYCEEYFNNPISIESSIETRRYDIPYYVTDYREAEAMWNWCPTENASQIVYRLCGWAEKNKEFILNLFE